MSEAALAPGVLVSGRLVSKELGAGGFSRVYEAKGQDGLAVALKLPVRPELVTMLRAERRALGVLAGRRFVRVLEDRLDEEPPHLVLELCAGGDLRALLERSPQKRLPAERVKALALAILDGVAEAHRQGIVHGDLKPENVLLDGEGEPKIADLGLSRASRRELIKREVELVASLATAADHVKGTLDYLAPEVRRGEEPTPRSDVFALGVLLYEMLIGERPVGLFKLPGAILASPPELDRVIARALASDPVGRYADAVAFLADLERAPVATPAPAISGTREATLLAVGLITSVVMIGVGLQKLRSSADATAPVAASGESYAAVRARAEAGDVGAMNLLGLRLVRGDGCAKDEAEGFAWGRKAALAGHPEAMFGVAQCLERGIGAPKDERAAVEWYRRAAKHGDTMAGPALEALLRRRPELR